MLEVAHRLAKAGFGIRFDPGDKERGQKVPDLQVTNSATGEDLYVEVSTLGPAVAERDASRTMERILDPLWRSIPFMLWRDWLSFDTETRICLLIFSRRDS